MLITPDFLSTNLSPKLLVDCIDFTSKVNPGGIPAVISYSVDTKEVGATPGNANSKLIEIHKMKIISTVSDKTELRDVTFQLRYYDPGKGHLSESTITWGESSQTFKRMVSNYYKAHLFKKWIIH